MTHRLARSLWSVLLPALVILGVFVYGVASSIPRIGQARTADFGHFYWAARAMLDGSDPYTSWHNGYIYPPLLAFLYTPLARFDFDTAAALSLVLNTLIVFATLVLSTRSAVDRFDIRRAWPAVLTVAAIASVIIADKIKGELQMWQTNAILLLMYALALTWLDRRPVLAGLALGVAFNIKYLPIVLLGWLLVRRRWRAAAGFAGGIVLFALLPALLNGWSENLRHLRVAGAGILNLVGIRVENAPIANVEPLAVSFSVSITSAIARLVGHEREHALGLALAAVAALAVGVAVIAMYRYRGVPLLCWPAAREQHDQPWRMMVAVEWASLIGLTLAFSPQTNTRHLYMLLLPCALAAGFVMKSSLAAPVRWTAIAGMVGLFAALTLPPGGPTFDPYVRAWREMGGPSLGILAMVLTLVWSSLAVAGRSLPGTPAAPADPLRP
ncbi:MAG: DUF2029 domain-containing protein [Phycisphaeraceae bacterium]|nr:DUF2029 domain-containing protein [Phycisphaeraceae bacterium]